MSYPRIGSRRRGNNQRNSSFSLYFIFVSITFPEMNETSISLWSVKPTKLWPWISTGQQREMDAKLWKSDRATAGPHLLHRHSHAWIKHPLVWIWACDHVSQTIDRCQITREDLCLLHTLGFIYSSSATLAGFCIQDKTSEALWISIFSLLINNVLKIHIL